MIQELKCILQDPLMWLRWFGPGTCRCCRKFTLWILKSEGAHEECWLEEK